MENELFYSIKDNRLFEVEPDDYMIVGYFHKDKGYVNDAIALSSFEQHKFDEPLNDDSDEEYYIENKNGEKLGFAISKNKYYLTMFGGVPFDELRCSNRGKAFRGYFITHKGISYFAISKTPSNTMNPYKEYPKGVVDLLYSDRGLYIFKNQNGGNSAYVMPKSGFPYFVNKEKFDKFNKDKLLIYPFGDAVKSNTDSYVITKTTNGDIQVYDFKRSQGEYVKKNMYYEGDGDELVQFNKVDYIIKNPTYNIGSMHPPFVCVLKKKDSLILVTPNLSYGGKVQCKFIGKIYKASDKEVAKNGWLLSCDNEYVYAHVYDFTEAKIEHERYHDLILGDNAPNFYSDEYEKEEERYKNNLKEIYKRVKIIKKFPILKINNETGEMEELVPLNWESTSTMIAGEALFTKLKEKCMYDRRKDEE